MKTENSFHRTPQYIVDFVMSLTNNGSFLDLCAGDGALTNSEELESLVSIDINKNLLKNVKQGKKINANLLGFNDKSQKEAKQKLLDDIGYFDYLLMNPPFENYKDFLSAALDILEWNSDAKAIFILPKKALAELTFNAYGIESKTVFNNVDFGTAIVDIVVIKLQYRAIEIDKKKEISNEFINPQCAKFISILSEFNFALGATYKGVFIHDSYTFPCESGTIEWRTDFLFNGDEYSVSTFFEQDHIPTMDEIVRQIQDYIRLWVDCFFIEKVSIASNRISYEPLHFCEYNYFLSETDIKVCDKFLDYVGFEAKTLDDYRKVSFRVYQDYKLFKLIENTRVFDELLNIDLDENITEIL